MKFKLKSEENFPSITDMIGWLVTTISSDYERNSKVISDGEEFPMDGNVSQKLIAGGHKFPRELVKTGNADWMVSTTHFYEYLELKGITPYFSYNGVQVFFDITDDNHAMMFKLVFSDLVASCDNE